MLDLRGFQILDCLLKQECLRPVLIPGLRRFLQSIINFLFLRLAVVQPLFQFLLRNIQERLEVSILPLIDYVALYADFAAFSHTPAIAPHFVELLFAVCHTRLLG